MSMIMHDSAAEIRQAFIRANHPLAIKLHELRERMHRDGRTFIGEEAKAERAGWQVFHQHKGWEPKK